MCIRDRDEVERITETGEKSFFAEIKDRFGDSLYQVGRGIRLSLIHIQMCIRDSNLRYGTWCIPCTCLPCGDYEYRES